jgi:thymidine kinase
MLNNLSSIFTDNHILELYNKSDVVIIDEAQFFTDLYPFIENELKNQHIINKIFIVSGLSGDSKMNSIGDILKLIPLADEVVKLHAYCIKCKDGTIASFSKRINTLNDSQILIGKDDCYIPVCRFHFYN